MHGYASFFRSGWKGRNQIKVSQQSNTAKVSHLFTALLLNRQFKKEMQSVWTVCVSAESVHVLPFSLLWHKENQNVSTFHSRWVKRVWLEGLKKNIRVNWCRCCDRSHQQRSHQSQNETLHAPAVPKKWLHLSRQANKVSLFYFFHPDLIVEGFRSHWSIWSFA